MSIHGCGVCGAHMVHEEPRGAWVFTCPGCGRIWQLRGDGTIRLISSRQRAAILNAAYRREESARVRGKYDPRKSPSSRS